jgi:hypothetical protein
MLQTRQQTAETRRVMLKRSNEANTKSEAEREKNERLSGSVE